MFPEELKGVSTRMTSIARTAHRNDICVLLDPSFLEKVRLGRYHRQLQAIFGGTPCNAPHVTCQRFALTDNTDALSVINTLQKEISTFKPFPLFAESLMSFYADFWHCTVLRWKIESTGCWQRFKLAVETALTSQGCPPHYPPTQAITATALESIAEVDMASTASEVLFPCFLFDVRHVVLSQIQGANRFRILARFDLTNGDSSVQRLSACPANNRQVIRS